MYNYKTLEDVSIKNLYETFTDSFSDYEVKIDLPLSRFENMLIRRGYNPAVSIGAFKEYELVGFIFNGLRSWKNKKTVYDTGTGVVYKYRKQGITTTMFENIKKVLQQNNVEQYLLEVIKTNVAAFELYKKQGFQISRELECFQINKSDYKQVKDYDIEHIDNLTEQDWNNLKCLWEIEPSWQNSIDSVKAVKEGFVYSLLRQNGIIVGYGIIDKKTGDIPQIAVHKDYRGKGIGRSIITDLIENTESEKISIINIDGRYKSMMDMLVSLGFKQFVNQYEMVLDLTV